MPLFLLCLQDTDNNVWLGAAFGLEDLMDQNEKQRLYIPALVKSLDSSNETIRANAAMFLKRNDPDVAAKAEVK